MKGQLMYRNSAFMIDQRSAAQRAFVAGVLWLRVGFIAASALMMSLVMLWSGEARPAYALAGAIGGGIVAAFAWRRSWRVLRYADESTAAMAPGPSATPSRSLAQTSRTTSC